MVTADLCAAEQQNGALLLRILPVTDAYTGEAVEVTEREAVRVTVSKRIDDLDEAFLRLIRERVAS